MASNYSTDSELSDDFIKTNFNMIRELYENEIFLYDRILNNKLKKSQNIILFDKDWLEKWKNLVGFENLKEKCNKCKIDEDIGQIMNEVRSLFIKLNTKEKLNDLGKMDSSKLFRISGKKRLINEESNFVPLLSNQCIYFIKSIT